VPEPVGDLCTLLVATAARCRLYGLDHRLTLGSLDRLMGLLDQAFADAARVRIAVGGGELLFNDHSVRIELGPTYSLARRLSAKGVGFVEILPGAGRDEVLAFCVELEDPRNRSVLSRPRVRVGEATLDAPHLGEELESARVQGASGRRRDGVRAEVLRLQELHHDLYERLSFRHVDYVEIVESFLTRFERRRELFLHLAEIRDHHLFTFIHTCNVTNLTIGFALALGLGVDAVKELAVAALLHDVGKNFVPTELLDKPTRLTPAEWAVVERHPIEGAAFLLRQPEYSSLAVVAAYEHHMHYLPGGGYPVLTRGRGPSPQAQLIAVVDAFDALFARRSYHREYHILEVLNLLRDDRGTVFNPWLIDTFTRFVTVSLDAGLAIESAEPMPEPPPGLEGASGPGEISSFGSADAGDRR
jgi:HD-GYP domain-containing protein (c-di-GMP phosphodiesterase class II)